MVSVEHALKARRGALERLQTENDLLLSQQEECAEKALERATELTVGQEAIQFLEDVANSRRSTMKDQIEAVVTEALILIYGLAYKSELVYDVKNNRSSLDIVLTKTTEAGEVRRKMNGFGGGVSDTISVPLRILVILASRQTDRVCFLDECYKHMDVERIDSVAEFIHEISSRLELQIIMCSHHQVMKDVADRAFMIGLENGSISRVTRI